MSDVESTTPGEATPEQEVPQPPVAPDPGQVEETPGDEQTETD